MDIRDGSNERGMRNRFGAATIIPEKVCMHSIKCRSSEQNVILAFFNGICACLISIISTISIAYHKWLLSANSSVVLTALFSMSMASQ